MKKALIVTSVYDFMTFLVNDVEILKSMGYEIHYATNMKTDEWLQDKGKLDYLGFEKHQIDFGRTPFDKTNIEAYKQMKALIDQGAYDVIHCHTPVASAVCRIAARKSRKKGTKVIYTCHGFHFHKKSSKKDWLIYYPVEKIMAHFCDAIITINQEDYHVIQGFSVKYKKYIPGVGIDLNKFSPKSEKDIKELRKKYILSEKAFVLVSTGELSDRKNQSVIIRAISQIKNNKDIMYIICGEGDNHQKYLDLAKQLGLDKQVIIMGQVDYQTVLEILSIADAGAFPSRIEGLGMSGLEVLAAGKPLIASNIHGITDYAIDEYNSITCDPDDADAFADAISRLYSDKELYRKLESNTKQSVVKFSKEESYKAMEKIYCEILRNEI